MHTAVYAAMKKIADLDTSRQIVSEEIKAAIVNDNKEKINFLRETIQIINAERKRQKQRIYTHRSYMKKKANDNKEIINPGMTVYFYIGQERKIGVVKRLCPKTFIVNELETNIQWQIKFSLVRATRKHYHKAA